MSDYKPITGELRKYATVSWDPWPDARDVLYQMCDRIDAIHAGLERENAELKAELDRVTGEQEEHAHARGESITDELREYVSTADRDVYTGKILAIADRIDAEHERAVMSAMNDALYHANDESMAELGWVRGPLDKDGKTWRSGDMSDSNWGVIEGIAYENGKWFIRGHDTSAPWLPADSLLHYHAPTVEDVLREFALKVAGEECMTMRTGVVEEYAKKVREVLA